jgi:hypothetical protein
MRGTVIDTIKDVLCLIGMAVTVLLTAVVAGGFIYFSFFGLTIIAFREGIRLKHRQGLPVYPVIIGVVFIMATLLLGLWVALTIVGALVGKVTTGILAVLVAIFILWTVFYYSTVPVVRTES